MLTSTQTSSLGQVRFRTSFQPAIYSCKNLHNLHPLYGRQTCVLRECPRTLQSPVLGLHVVVFLRYDVLGRSELPVRQLELWYSVSQSLLPLLGHALQTHPTHGSLAQLSAQGGLSTRCGLSRRLHKD